jgi:hypothetical protein
MLVTLYCDASFRDGEAGGAAYIRSNKGVLKWGGGFRCETPQEAEAITMLTASKFTLRNWPETKILYIVCDNKACIEYLWPFNDIKLKHKPTKKHLDELLQFAKKNKLTLRSKWIKSHQSISDKATWANNEVDKIAKNHRTK